jgi:asparagine synthase (glutamine-hydrolysing)
MCGIAGFAGAPFGAEASRERLRAMCEAIRHRGPDDEGALVASGGVGLSMRRLAIIDVARGHQPIHNEDGTVSVVFNGEIYNHRQLQQQLEREGHVFRTHSDTEALVHLYERDGDRMVDALRGMFTFAIWDHRRERLLLARDRVGIKPLYLWRTSWGVAFASEMRAFLALPDFPRDIDPRAIGAYLGLGYVPDPRSVFTAAEKLPPGHVATWSRDEGLRLRRYWSPVRPEVPVSRPEEAIEELRRLLDDAVRSHLESEVPLGAFLSGGIDSSTVVACMARAMDRPVETFTIGFEEGEFDEAPDAAAVARALGTKHTQLIVRPDAEAIVDSVAAFYDEPFGDASALPTYLVSKLARESVTVTLSGDGGDELFAGYTRYDDVMRRWNLPGGPLRRAARSVFSALPHGTKGRAYLLDVARDRRGRYATAVTHRIEPVDGGAARPELVELVAGAGSPLDPWFDEGERAGRDFLSQMTLVDMGTYLPGDILTKVDRASMAVSLEARVPILDHLVVEFAAALPSHLKRRDGTGKWILREAVKPWIPATVLEKRKQGFGVPLNHWFRGPLRGLLDALGDERSRVAAFVIPAEVRRIVREHLTGRRNHQGRLWRLLVLERWMAALESGQLQRSSAEDEFAQVIVDRAVALPHA